MYRTVTFQRYLPMTRPIGKIAVKLCCSRSLFCLFLLKTCIFVLDRLERNPSQNQDRIRLPPHPPGAMAKAGPNSQFNGLVEDCEQLAQQAYGVSVACDRVVVHDLFCAQSLSLKCGAGVYLHQRLERAWEPVSGAPTS